MTVTWRELVAEARSRLDAAGVDAPDHDARRLAEQATGTSGADLALVLDEAATELTLHHFDSMLERRLNGEPLQYVLGSWGFRHLDLFLDRRVLIPRPETEIVVEHALVEIDRCDPPRDQRVCVVDLGTGSGAIALSIAFERDRTEVWAVDRSEDALAVARANLAGLGRAAARVSLGAGDWFEAVPGELRGALDVVVSNPPYVAESDDLPEEVSAWEPAEALVAGPRGTEALERILADASSWLRPNGAVVLELAPHQGEEVGAFAEQQGYSVELHPDLTGRVRVLIARR